MGNTIPSIAPVLKLDTSVENETFYEMWYQIFLWFLFSSLIIHALAALAAFICLRQHKVGRFYSLIIIVMGILGPITGGIITSAVIAGLFKTTEVRMYPLWAFVCGWGQTLGLIFISFSRILATL